MSDRYAVFGNPIAHSKSPDIHALFAASLGQSIHYTREIAPVDGFASVLSAFFSNGGRGANVTAPFKIEAASLAQHASERVRRAGAANALKLENDVLHAENFDGVGLVTDVEHNLGVSLHGKRVLILGAGGAARGIVLPILDAKPNALVIANRTLISGLALAEQFFGYGAVEANAPTALRGAFDVVINATSASLSGLCPEVSPSVFAPHTLAYELVYGKGLTPFLKLAQSNGASKIADGVGMLVEQAAEAYQWWRGVRPATKPVITQFTIPLQ